MKDNNNDNYQYNDNDYNGDYYEKPPGNSKKIIYIAVTVVLLIVLAGLGFFLKKKHDITSMINNANNLVEIGDYDEAMKIYSELYSKTGDVEYRSMKNKIGVKKEINNTMEEAKKLEQEGEPAKALKLYMQVPKEDSEAYSKASAKAESLKAEVIRKASALIDAGDKTSASTMLSDYISVVPDDKKAVDLLKKCSGKSEEQIKQIIVTGGSAPSAPAPDTSNLDAAYSVARSIQDTYQYITSSAANVRSGPSKSSSVVGNLHRGDAVYIYDTYVESASRIWCKTDSGWISYNTMNNTIK